MLMDTAAPLTTRDVIRLVHEETGELISGDCVRRWERTGSLHADRTAGGMRLFRPEAVRELIRRRSLGRGGEK